MINNLKKKLYIGRSLKQQVLLFTIAPIVVAITIYSAITVYGIVSLGDVRIREYRGELVARKKEELKNYVDLAFKNIEGLKSDQVIAAVKRMRYGKDGLGYFWINDIAQPYPKMVMHPTIPSLDGQILSDSKFNCALGKGKNLFVAFNDACLARGEGYVDYLWPKPTKSGLTKDMPKLSYVRLYEPLNWVIGTGLYIDDIDALAAKERLQIKNDVATIIIRNILVSVLIIIGLYLFVSYFLDKYMVKPFRLITSTFQNYNNDLTVKIPVTTKNEIGELAASFNTLTAHTREIITNVSDAVRSINTIGGEVSVSVEQQATVASEQSAAVAEITATMEELSASSMQIAEHSKTVVDLATKAWDSTKDGAAAAETVMMKMHEIHADSQNSIHEIVELGRKSREISKVMEIINTIADQTKLIAFNAALEASSAGEAGKRFGVVAVEIRRLADNVMESTGEIESKINEIQDSIHRLVMASEKGSKGIQEGIDHTNQTATSLVDIVDAAQATKEAAKQISLSTQQQKTASTQVVAALREITEGAGQTSDAISQISGISKNLTLVSDTLKDLIGVFKLEEYPARVDLGGRRLSEEIKN